MQYIAIDWGSTNLRAHLVNQGEVQENIESDQGALNLESNEFQKVLFTLCAPWLKAKPNIPIYMSGMVGRRNGWIEAPYLSCPVDLNQMSEQLIKVPNQFNRNILLTPGLMCNGPTGMPDVIRGEEQLIFGALKILETGDTTRKSEKRIICLPGTHSKWAETNNFTVESFATFFSGELFKLLSESSSLLTQSEKYALDQAAFDAGVRQSMKKGGVLHQVFSVRTQQLTQNISESYASNYLSGLIIGNEIKEANNLYISLNPITYVGSKSLNQRYQRATELYGYESECINSESAFIAATNALTKSTPKVEMSIC